MTNKLRAKNIKALKKPFLTIYDIAYLEVTKDIKNGDYKIVTADDHVKSLKDVFNQKLL